MNLFTDQEIEEFRKTARDAAKQKAAGSIGTMTKEQIMQVKDRTERQRLIAANMNLFRK